MFKKILIANRGEIACRIIRTAKRMNIQTVAVYSEADQDAPHVAMADESVLIGPPPSADSYLDIEKIIQAVKDSGADAVHPGYGFLSENRAFAEALAKAKVAFIGPSADAIAAMGDKVESKKLAKEAGVNVIPGHIGAVKDAKEAAKIAKDIGYPVMLKASAGGGGKGMRIARSEKEVSDGFRAAQNEAKSSFGDDRIFIEKYIDEPRHIEIQVLADTHGNVIHLGERECSIQRRHQKVIEESPSPAIKPKTRDAMGAQAIALARKVDYCSAGTVEFILDGQGNFYFLEMNTRLQVEHPVTELVTGIDLVEQMIRVASGEKLAIAQKDVRWKGWAVEARVYAEDPLRGFLPSIGRLVRFREPAGEGVRVDSGVTEGSEISVYYDPMIAKLCTHGSDRPAAVARMRGALDEYFIRGLDHNIPFLAAVMMQPRFLAGELTTNFIAEEFPDGFSGVELPKDEREALVAVAAMVHHRYAERTAVVDGQMPPASAVAELEWVVILDGAHYPVALKPALDGFDVLIDDKIYAVRSEWALGSPVFRGTVNERPVTVQIDRNGISFRLTHGGATSDVLVVTIHGAALASLMPVKEPPDLSRFLLSPMPGLLVAVAVEQGQEVKAGAELAVVEAMKMENTLRATQDCKVMKVCAKAGDSLAVDQIILEFEA
ncbi:MAG: acetyl-CoA carboxylase biotin carboxylase subunit [Alphaproteobacteria bacterium]|nr:acetyl-CoA carboxylase biotin carboxylase subunit [Alphaproteobacteria bacterium]